LASPDEIEVELSLVNEDYLLGLSLIDKELSEIKLVWLSRLHLNLGATSKYGVMNLVSLTFNIEHQRSGLSLDVANQVVIIVQLIFGLEKHFNWDL
jgi:hypothetical protein